MKNICQISYYKKMKKPENHIIWNLRRKVIIIVYHCLLQVVGG